VRIIGHRKRAGKVEADITADLTAHCAKLRAPRRNICEAIVPSRIDNISAQLAIKRKPQDICESLGFTRPPPARRFVQRDQCVKYAEKAKTQAEKVDAPGANESLKGKLPKPFAGRGLFSRLFGKVYGCRDAPADERVSCYVVSRLVVKGLRGDLRASMTGDEICDKLEAKKLVQFTPLGDANATSAVGKHDSAKTDEKSADEKKTDSKTTEKATTDEKTGGDKKADDKATDVKGASGTPTKADAAK
jgi:hypothetical protein